MTMVTDGLYHTQITTAIHDFVQVWNEFEATLKKELAKIQDNLPGTYHQRDAQHYANLELFYRACNSIYPQGNITMSEFSSALSVPLSTATRMADWLADKGYIQRLPDFYDRRVVRVALTNKGRGLNDAIDQYIRLRIQLILSSLTNEERGIFLNLVGKIVTGLKEAGR